MFHRRAATVYWTKVPHGRNGTPRQDRGLSALHSRLGDSDTRRCNVYNQWIYRFLYYRNRVLTCLAAVLN
jgi:hypothetical protein